MNDPAVTALEAVARVQSLLALRDGVYYLGAGNYQPEHNDNPYTPSPYGPAADCRVVFLHGWKVKQHRPSFNHGSWATVSDDVNYNSLIEDGLHKHELGVALPATTMPRPGDIIAYPTINLPGHPQPFIGHGALVESVPANYAPGGGWHQLTTLQCMGPPRRGPAVLRVDGHAFDHHDADWPKAEHRTWLIRPMERP